MNTIISPPVPSPARQRIILATCCLSLLVVSMDVTIVNVALPDIGSHLHTPMSGLQWTVDAYSLVLAMLFVAAGSLGDRFGRRRIFRTGLSLFVLGSLLCSTAPGLGWLVGFRVAQAVGGSMLNPVAMSIVVNEFREPGESGKLREPSKLSGPNKPSESNKPGGPNKLSESTEPGGPNTPTSRPSKEQEPP